MARLQNHYEAAFQDFLISRRWPFVPIDEAKKAVYAGARIKSFDFLVYPPAGPAWLVDVKGRKFPYDLNSGRRYWENWVTQEDIVGLDQWKEAFGEGFTAVYCFVYWLGAADNTPVDWAVHEHQGETYALLCIDAEAYAAAARPRSAKWETVSVPVTQFKKMVTPISALTP